ncbi:cutinase family protein [Goekera deserti]|uniref:cutinase family protein n=1 Tax=Goekera deserti TaxID=2497753 RepID=UPI00192EDD2D|nr:cutinase family protein [Goekera deserti]
MQLPSLVSRVLAGLSLTVLATTGAIVATQASASAATPCADIDVVFARGSTEPQGLGTLGTPFVSALRSQLTGYTVASYAVVYAADITQTSAGAGSRDAVNYITQTAAACPNTRFVLGGYSQGGTVIDKTVGIQIALGGAGAAIPANLSDRVSAVVAFGNPLGLTGGATIASSSTVYGPRSKDYCNQTDPVCGSQPKTGSGSHLSYGSNGAVTQAATFAAGLVKAGTAPTTPTPTPTPTPTDPTTPTTPPVTPPATGTCVRDDTSDHVEAGRATAVFGQAYALGSRNRLGRESSFNVVSLRQTAPDTWTLVSAC